MNGFDRWLRWLGYYVFTGILVSGLYLESSFSLLSRDDRPIGYGLIIRAFSWKATLWPMVIFQGVVASWLIMLVVREVIPEKRRHITIHLTLLAFLLLCSGLPWYAAQLMADNFTPLVLLIAFLLFRAKLLGPVREAALWLLLFFFLATHNSHFPMAALLSMLIALRHIRTRGFRGQRAFWWKWGALNVVALGAAAMVASFNYSAHGRFQLFRASNIFLAGRLYEPGIMAD